MQRTPASYAWPVNASDNAATDWRNRWLGWQQWYAQAFVRARYEDVENFQLFNEPDLYGSTLSQSQWIEMMKYGANAVEAAIADVNRIYGKQLRAHVYGPVTTGPSLTTAGGTDWGDVLLQNRNMPVLSGTSVPGYQLFDHFDYHNYGSSPATFGTKLAGAIADVNTLTGGQGANFPVTISEFNTRTSANYNPTDPVNNPSGYTPDSLAMSSRLGQICVNLAKNRPDELYLFKFTDAGGANNGVHWQSANGNVGGATKSADVYRLFTEGFAGRTLLAAPTSADADISLAAAYDSATGTKYVMAANADTATAHALSLDLTPWGVAAGTQVMVEQVSDRFSGNVSQMIDVGSNRRITVNTDPGGVVLVTLPDNQAGTRTVIPASQDAHVRQANSTTNFGSATSLLVQSGSGSGTRYVSYLQFPLAGVDVANLTEATLGVYGWDSGATGDSAAGIISHVYGLTSGSWTQSGIKWSNAPNIDNASSYGTITGQIDDTYVTGVGTSAEIIGQIAATGTEKLLSLDVGRWVQQRIAAGATTVNFMITRDFRFDGDLDQAHSLTMRSSEYSGGAFAPTLTVMAVPKPATVAITVASGTQMQAQAGRLLLSGTTPVQKTGAGTVVLDQANTLTGSTTVTQGTLQLGTANALSSSAVTVAAGATLAVGPQLTAIVPALVNNGIVDLDDVIALVSGGLYDAGPYNGASGAMSFMAGGTVGNASIAMGSSALVGRNTYAFGSSATALLLNVTGTIYNLVWDSAVASGTWNDTSAVWLQSGTGSPITFVNNDNTTFGSAATVSVPSAVTTGSMVISNASGAVGLSGAGSVAAYSLSKSGAGSATLGAPATISNGLAVSAGSLDVTGTTTVTAGGVTVSGGSFVSSGQTNISAGGFNVSAGSAALNAAGSITGGITLTGGALTIGAAQTVNGDTSVSGGGSLTLNSGTLGAGTVTLNNGTLTAGSGVAALANAVSIGAGGGTIATDNSLALGGAISGVGNTLTKSGAGTLTLNGGLGTAGNGLIFNVSSGTVVMAGNNNKVLNGGTITGNVSLTAGSLLLGGNVTGSGTIAASNGTTIKSDLSAGGGTKTLSTPVSFDGAIALQSVASRPLVLSGALAGSGTVTSAGSTKVSLTGAGSTFSGSLVVSHVAAGGYTEATSQALGSAASIVVNANGSRTGAQLNFANSTTGTFGGVISGAGIVGIGGSAKVVLTGANTYSAGTQLDGDVGITSVSNGTSGSLGTGTITSISSAGRIFLESGTSINFTQAVNTGAASTSVLAFAGTGKTFFLTGSVAGSGQLKASSGGLLDLTSQNATTNTNTGGIEIGNAFVRAAEDVNLGTGTVNFSGTDSNSGWIAAATGTISRAFTIGGTGTNANIKAVFDTAGYDLTLSSQVNNKLNTALGSLVKIGAGSLVLSGSNGYTGATTVSAGRLAVNGSLDAASSVTVLGGATLGGNGTIGGITTVAGVVAPGNSIGTLTIANDVVWNGAATAGSSTDWVFELGTSNTSDLLAISGGASDFLKDSTAGSVYRFDFANSAEQGTFTLVTWGGITNFLAGDFSYTGLANGNTATFSMTSNGLNVIIVPEPASLMLVALGGAGVAVFAGRRRRVRG